MTIKIKVPKHVKKFLNNIEPFNGGEWERREPEIKCFKEVAKKQLQLYQKGKCAYCGLLLATRTPELEHIAPKGGAIRPKHTEYMFLPINLVMACRDCNSPKRKGMKDTIITKEKYYFQCEFSIVHPYLDNVDEYFYFIRYSRIDGGIIPIPKKGLSQQRIAKAINTIKMFGLNTEEKILLRAQEKYYELRTQLMSQETNKMIDEILLYKK